MGRTSGTRRRKALLREALATVVEVMAGRSPPLALEPVEELLEELYLDGLRAGRPD